MSKLKTVLNVYKEAGVTGVVSAIVHRNRIYKYLVSRLETILPAQTEFQLTKDAAQYWSESAQSQNIRDLSHWVGEGRWKDADAWENIGKSHFKMWQRFASSCSDEQASKRMVEWGSGGGANAIVFAQIFENFYGVDISDANLNECEKQLTMRGFKGFVPILVNAEHPEEAVTQIAEPCDFFLSTAVFQHFPGKDYGARVLRVASNMLRPGGIALVQIRYDDLSPRFRSKNRDYDTHAITFTSYKLHEFWSLASENGFTPHCIELQPDVNYAYYYLRKKKT